MGGGRTGGSSLEKCLPFEPQFFICKMGANMSSSSRRTQVMSWMGKVLLKSRALMNHHPREEAGWEDPDSAGSKQPLPMRYLSEKSPRRPGFRLHLSIFKLTFLVASSSYL